MAGPAKKPRDQSVSPKAAAPSRPAAPSRQAVSPRPATPARASASDLLVGVIMGSRSDWETMQHADAMLTELGVAHECQVVSAHRTPDRLMEYAAAAQDRGLEVIIAGAGGAAHLPGMVASKTTLPVLGVPIESSILRGVDSLLSIVQMPAGVPVATFAIGKAGAINAALFAAAVLAPRHPQVAAKLAAFRKNQTRKVLDHTALP